MYSLALENGRFRKDSKKAIQSGKSHYLIYCKAPRLLAMMSSAPYIGYSVIADADQDVNDLLEVKILKFFGFEVSGPGEKDHHNDDDGDYEDDDGDYEDDADVYEDDSEESSRI